MGCAAFDRLAFADVSKNLRETDDLAGFVVNRRERERDIDRGAAFREPDRFVMLQTIAAQRLRTRAVCFRPHGFRHNQLRVLSNYLSGRVAKKALGCGVPERDETLEGLSDNGVFRRLDDALEKWRRRYQVWHRQAALLSGLLPARSCERSRR